MPPRDHNELTSTVRDGEGSGTSLARLEKRLARERRARAEAETISERTTRQLYDHQQRLQLLTNVANAANEASSIGPAVDTCLELVRAHGGWTLGHAWLLPGAKLVSAGCWSGDVTRFEEIVEATKELSFASGEGLPGRVLAQQGTVWIDDFATEPGLTRGAAARRLGLHSSVAFPILAGGEVAGVLEFFSERIRNPDAEMLGLLRQVGSELGRVVERQRAAEMLRHEATRDSLTGLPNRRQIRKDLESLLARLRREPDRRGAVCFIDLDGFKGVNDSLGHVVADQVLVDVSRRLSSILRPYDSLGRLGGDEFVVICDSTAEAADLAAVAKRIASELQAPFELAGELFQLSASVGITEADVDRTADELIAEADAAMYRAKRQGPGRHEFYSPALGAALRRRSELERALRTAATNGELELFYQPEVELVSGRIVGMEALLRWRRPEGLVLPGEFIPLAEETGLIVPVGEWVLDHAVAQMCEWHGGALEAPPWVSVNLSVRQLADTSLVERLTASLSEHGADPSNLLLEVTESVVLDEGGFGLNVLTELNRLGTEIAIDDFGTGYASLSYLARFPARALKIDRSFVAALDDPRYRVIVAAMIDLGHGLGLTTVAEGIETVEQLTLLKELGCALGQGFLFARPMPAGEATDLLRRKSAYGRPT